MIPASSLSLSAGTSAVLELPELGPWQARVEWLDGERIAIALYARLPILASTLIGVSARLTFANERGLHRLPVAVLGTQRGGIIELTLLAEPEVDQRREHVRVSAPIVGVVEPADHAWPALHTYTLDVSGAGVLIAGAGPVEVGDAVAVTLRIPGASEPLTALSHIVRKDPDGHVAVAFDELDPRERERLVRFVFERQRLERQAAREGR